jgi:hypothetical protein
MMRDEDPFEEWFYLDQVRNYDEAFPQFYKQARAALDRLSILLEAPPAEKVNLAESGIFKWSAKMLAKADLSRACELYRRVVTRGGSGSTFVQEGLLEMIASTKDLASIPFWLEMLDFRRPHDLFAKRRRTYALAALARIAIAQKTTERFKPLREIARHQNPEVRALAVYYLGRACLARTDVLPPEVLADLTDTAQRDSAFGPRFHARRILQDAGSPAPLDNPGGIYLFKLPLGSRSHYRTIAVRSEHTLDHLHYAIQSAILWNADHLYSFFMNGKIWDQRYAFASPNEDEPPFTDEAIIGDLGLTLKHKFLYLFDYGDSHEFILEVVGIQPKAQVGKYPRVVESRGEAPEQYPEWE